MSRGESNPIVIQFADMAEFVDELRAIQAEVVRVWPGTFAVGREPCARYKVVNAQAHDGRQVATLACVVGVYQEIYGRPFGPTAERQKDILAERMETAVTRVQDHLRQALPGIAIRSGQIHTGLHSQDIQRGYWDGLDDIYRALKEGEA